MTKTTKTYQAIWMPGWYELDQPLTVGSYDRFWFYLEIPRDKIAAVNLSADETDLVFFNQLSTKSNYQIRYARVLRITQAQLGELTRIDTDGLDYIFYKVNGDELVVNAEENPGKLYESDLNVDDWSVRVELTEVSDPILDD